MPLHDASVRGPRAPSDNEALARELISGGAHSEPDLAEGGDDESPDDGLQACAEDLMKAMESKDAGAVADALRSAFAVLESQPHEEEDEGGEGE